MSRKTQRRRKKNAKQVNKKSMKQILIDEGVYKLRGDNRKKALADGLPVEYDRLAVYMVSVFHLSHWRLETLTNYLLAV